MRWIPAVVLLLFPQEDLLPGLVGEYFNVGEELRDFPYLDASRKPLLRRIDPKLEWDPNNAEFAETGLWDFFYARWTGVIRVPRDGTYIFTLESDDGSRLWIDGKSVVDHGGMHDMREKAGVVELKAGEHAFKADLFENDDKAAIKLSWQPPGGEKEIVPASAFFHRKTPGLDEN